MADTGKRVEVRFGAFACAIEGYDDPVVQMREVLTLMQQMIRETPALADRASQFGDAEVARLEHALDHSGGHGDAAPGIVVIRGGGGEPEDAETVDEIAPEAAGADEAAWPETSESTDSASVGDVQPGSAGPGEQPSSDAATAGAEVVGPASGGVPAEPGTAGAGAMAGVQTEAEPPSGLAARAAGESEPETALPGEDMPAAGRFREAEPVPEIVWAGVDGGREPAEADDDFRDWPADRDADPAHAAAPLAAAAAEAAFLADIAAALEPADAFGGTKHADDPAPELAAADDETGEAMDGERVAPTGTSDAAALAESGMSELTGPSEASERQDSAEDSATADEHDSAGYVEIVEAAGAPAPGGSIGDTLPAEDALDAEAAYGAQGDADRVDAPAAVPVPDDSGHDTEETDRAVALDATSGPITAGDAGQGQPTTDEPRPEQAATGEGEQPATEDGEPERADDDEEADPERAAIAASASGGIGASDAVEPALAGAAATDVAEPDDEAPPAAEGVADRVALNIFAPPPGAAPQGKASVNLFAPPSPAFAPPRGNSFRNIFAPPSRAEASAREPAFAGAGPERAPAGHRPKRAASLHDLDTEASTPRALAHNIFAPDQENVGEPLEETPDGIAPATAAEAAPAPRRSEGAGRFAALLGRIYGARAATTSEAPEARASINTAAPDPAGSAKGPSAADLAARAGVRSVPDLLAASAAWLTLVDDKLRFSRREVMEVFETLPGPHERTLEARIKGFGKLVRAGTLILVEEGVFSLCDAENDRYRELLDRR